MKVITYKIDTDAASQLIIVEFEARVMAKTEEEAIQSIYAEFMKTMELQEQTEEEEKPDPNPKKEPKETLIQKLEEGYLDINELSDFTGLQPTQIHNMVSQGKFPKYTKKLGNKSYWHKDDIQGYKKKEKEVVVLLKLYQVSERTKIPTTTLLTLIANNLFPKPDVDNLFKEEDIKEYIEKGSWLNK